MPAPAGSSSPQTRAIVPWIFFSKRRISPRLPASIETCCSSRTFAGLSPSGKKHQPASSSSRLILKRAVASFICSVSGELSGFRCILAGWREYRRRRPTGRCVQVGFLSLAPPSYWAKHPPASSPATQTASSAPSTHPHSKCSRPKSKILNSPQSSTRPSRGKREWSDDGPRW